MTDNYKHLRDAVDDCGESDYHLHQYEDAIRALLAERDALREALRWTAATLQDATSSLDLVFEEDQITLEGETKTVEQILDIADAALAQKQENQS